MATDVARLVMQFEAPGARRVQNTFTALQTGAVRLTKATDEQIAAQYRLNSTYQAFNKTAMRTAPIFKVQKGAMQQAGYQIGDFAVQVGAGQSALVAFSQQGAQLAGVLGPGGAVIGAVIAIGGAIAGALFRSLMDGKTATDDLEAAMDILADTLEKTDNDTYSLTERIRDLAKVSRVAAQLELQRGLIATRDAANSAAEAIAEMTEDKFDTTILGDFEAAISQAERLERMGISVSDAFAQAGGSSAREFRDGLALIRDEAENLNDEFGITEDSARQLISAIAVSRVNPTVEGFQRLQSALFAASQSAPSVNSEFVKIASNLSSLASQAVEAIQRGEDITEIINNFDEALKASDPTLIDYNEKVKELGQSFKDQAATIGLTERQVALYKLQRLEANGADSEAVETARRQITASFDKIEAFKREEDRLKLLREQYKITAAEDPLLQRQAAGDRGQDIIDGLRKEAEAVRMGLDQELAIRQAHKDRVIALDDGLRLGVLENAEDRNRLEVESLRQRNEQLRQIEMQKYEIFNSGQMAFLSASENLFGNLAAIAEKGGKDQFDTWKAMASAQAAVSTALAVANALTAAPPPVNFALAASVGALGAVQIAQIQGQEYQGSYLGGGYTGQGSRTGGVDGKGGFPAILHPNETVIDHTKGQSVGGEVVVNINNAPSGTRAEERTDANGTRFIEIFVADLNQGGPMSRAVQGAYGLRRQGR